MRGEELAAERPRARSVRVLSVRVPCVTTELAVCASREQEGTIARVRREISASSPDASYEVNVMSRISNIATLIVMSSFATIARATTYVVDAANGPGTDYRRLQSAIDAAADGDVLLVRRGSYGSIDIGGKALTVVGNGSSTHFTIMQIHDTAPHQRVAIVGLGGPDPYVYVNRAAGPVVIQEMHIAERIVVENAVDVRLRSCEVRTHSHPGVHVALGVTNARVEVVRSTFRGPGGLNSGGSGALLLGGRLHWLQSEAYGSLGASSDPSGGTPALAGGTGIQALFGELIVAGRASIVQGGNGGQDTLNCALSAPGGSGIWNDATTEWSSATIEGGWGLIGPNCTALQSSPFAGDMAAAEIVPPNPVLDVRGLPLAGGTLRFTIEGPVGALARAWLGRNATRRIDAGVQIEELTERSLTLELGVVPASGSIAFDYAVPGSWSAGTFFCAQAEIVLPGSGAIRRTNSTPLVVR